MTMDMKKWTLQQVTNCAAIVCAVLILSSWLLATKLLLELNEFHDEVLIEMKTFKVVTDQSWDGIVEIERKILWMDAAENEETVFRSKRFSRMYARQQPECNCAFRSRKCARGPAGPQGEPGLDGELGEPGRNGRSGIPSLRRKIDRPKPVSTCIQCPAGLPGPLGQAGAIGSRGVPGKQGLCFSEQYQGLSGAQGDPGPPGEIGEMGPVGVAGGNFFKISIVPGRKGSPGPQGRPGEAGPPGEDNDNAISEAGTVGPMGPPGEPGQPGLDGPLGQAGDSGLPGSDAQYCGCPSRSVFLPFYKTSAAVFMPSSAFRGLSEAESESDTFSGSGFEVSLDESY
ncbi:unnamed protein product [Anisakis simplex]|uniref:Col_cuticle_N domain-containing protein n=1 Tax=Anisakis simplex TaxID=6269 RepID=A0A0M3K2I5_ANISI|nr:unnamed protein product [Anisakis simplex]